MATKKDNDKQPAVIPGGSFGVQIPVTYEEKIKHLHPALPPGHLNISIVGASSSGKSTAMCGLLPQIQGLEKVIILSCIPENKCPPYRAIRNYCEKVGYEFGIANNPDDGMELIADFTERLDPKKKVFIIMDDFSMQKSGRNDKYNNINAIISALLRNVGAMCCTITQNPTNIPTLVRTNSNVRICFRLHEEHAIRSIKADFVNSGVVSKSEFDELFRIIQDKDNLHSYLMLDRDRNKLFIYLPKNGEIQEVEFVGSESGGSNILELIKGDQTLQKMIQAYRDKSDDPLNRFMNRRVKKDLDNYITFFAHKHHIDRNRIEEILDI